MVILGLQIQTRRRRRAQKGNPEDGVHELLPRYTFNIAEWVSDPMFTLWCLGTDKAADTQVKALKRLTRVIYCH